ncbi:MAG: PQQ-binding-like beta-propeller repeat protein [Planctomycetota bacterium]|nr:PQQ-binding-like beta-propeller repeat protein [Planctomycetota bacterium]
MQRVYSLPLVCFRRSRTTLSLVLTSLCLVSVCRAQFALKPVPADNVTRKVFHQDRDLSRPMSTAIRQFKDKNTAAGLELLQYVIDQLESRGDAFYQPNSSQPNLVSLKSYSQTLIAGLPTDGREAYERQFGPNAQHIFEEGVAEGDLPKIASVVSRFLHTKAGRSAARWLGAYYFDRDEPTAAAMYLELLRNAPDLPANWEPSLSLQASLAWFRAGLTDHAVEILNEVRAKHGDSLALGGRKVAAFNNEAQATVWLSSQTGVIHFAKQPANETWLTFGGNLARTGGSRTGSPVWDSEWKYQTVQDLGARSFEEDAKTLVKKAADALTAVEKRFVSNDLLTLPAQHPLLMHDVRKNRDLVVFKALDGLRAINARTGELVWVSLHTDEDFWKVLRDPTPTNTRNTGNQSALEMFLAQRAFRDLTAGTISSDGRLIFSIEDNGFFNRYSLNTRGPRHPLAPRNANSLVFVEASTGKLKYGFGCGNGGFGFDEDWQLEDHFFLGAPLVLGDQLFCMAEVAGEIRLVAIQVNRRETLEGDVEYSGRVTLSQPLVRPADDVNSHPMRRMSGISPAYSDGVLICQTTAGAVVGFDLKRRSLLWGYPYGTHVTAASSNPRALLIARMNAKSKLYQDEDEGRWVSTATMVSKGRVLLTPRDSNELHCINLTDGGVAWRRPRSNSLYLACVHQGNAIVVGNSSVEAVSIETGLPAWPQSAPITMPSGHGYRSKDHYFVPQNNNRIAVVDLRNGRVLAELPSLQERSAGNLVASNELVVTQTSDTVSAFLTSTETEGPLAKDASDKTRLRKGLIQIAKGEVDEGMKLVRIAADAGFDPARHVVVQSYLEGLRLDFKKYRSETEVIEPWIKTDADRAEFLRLYAFGLHTAGESIASAKRLLELSNVDAEKSPLQQIEGDRLVRSDRWIRSRLKQIRKEVPAATRVELDKVIDEHVRKAESAIARSRVASSVIGLPQADLALRRVAESTDGSDSLRQELQLRLLARSTDAQTAATATAELTRLAIAGQRWHHADEYLRQIEQQWAGETVDATAKLTGRQFVEQFASNAGLKALRDPSPIWPQDAIAKVTPTANPTAIARTYVLDFVGSRGHRQNWSFALDSSRTHLLAFDGLGVEKWKLPLAAVGKRVLSTYGNSIEAYGDVLVATLSNFFVVIDASSDSSAKILWSRYLIDVKEGDPNSQRINFQRAMIGGAMRVRAMDASGRPFGTVGAVTDEQLCYQVGKSLYAADVLTGDVLWEKRDIPRGSSILGDHERVTLVPPGVDSGVVLDANDGRPVGSVVIPTGSRLIMSGRMVLTLLAHADPKTLDATDSATGKSMWKRELAENTHVFITEGDEIGMLEATGLFRVLKVADGRERFVTQLEDSSKVQRIAVHRSRDRYVVLTYEQEKVVNNINIFGFGTNHFRINGFVYGLDRSTGKKLWSTRVENQSLDPGQPDNAPVMMLTVRTYQIVRQPGARVTNTNRSIAKLLDVRNGKILFDSEKDDADPKKNARTTSYYPVDVKASVADSSITIQFGNRGLKVTFDKS